MASFTKQEWKEIRQRLNEQPNRYGVPARTYGSAVVGSFNIRKLGRVESRDEDTWQFLADICRQFDLLAIQEIQTDTSGLEHLLRLTGQEFGLVLSDTTGAFPNEPGLDERLAFIYNTRTIRRRGVVTDVTWDRTKVLQTLAENFSDFADALAPVADQTNVSAASIRDIKMPTFLAFIRTPFGVEFELRAHPGAERFHFMGVNAHLNFGKFISDRRQEFNALLAWLLGKIHESDSSNSQNLLLLGDLNLDFDNPTTDLPRIIDEIKSLNDAAGQAVNVLFPFLDAHPNSSQLLAQNRTPMGTNARIDQTFDQIGIFSRDERLRTSLAIQDMGKSLRGPDYGVIDFANLFAETLFGEGRTVDTLNDIDERREFFSRFEHKVSDHLPIWFRFPLPDAPPNAVLRDVGESLSIH